MLITRKGGRKMLGVVNAFYSPPTPFPARRPLPFSSLPKHRREASFFGARVLFPGPASPPLFSKPASGPVGCEGDDLDGGEEEEEEEEEVVELDAVSGDEDDGFEIEIRKVEGRGNGRRIESRVRVDADLETVWSVLTDYEGLTGFIPSLAVSQLLEKKDKFARLYQVGQQNLALGLKFNAKGVLDCYERDLELLPTGRRRDIDFKMVEGDFQTFEGKWSIEQTDSNMCKTSVSPEFQTTLTYIVELEPKIWLPVRLLEGRLCKAIKTNLFSVREEAHRVQTVGGSGLS